MITSKVYRVVRYFDDYPENTMCKCDTIEEARIKCTEHNNRKRNKNYNNGEILRNKREIPGIPVDFSERRLLGNVCERCNNRFQSFGH